MHSALFLGICALFAFGRTGFLIDSTDGVNAIMKYGHIVFIRLCSFSPKYLSFLHKYVRNEFRKYHDVCEDIAKHFHRWLMCLFIRNVPPQTIFMCRLLAGCCGSNFSIFSHAFHSYPNESLSKFL